MPQASPYDHKPWQKFYDAGVPASVDYEPITVPQAFFRAAEEFADQTAVTFQGFTLTYSALADMVRRCATVLDGFGVKKGDRVAIHLPNLIPCVAAYYAVLSLGGVVVMNNPLYSDRELSHQFNDSGAKVLITLDLLANRMIGLKPLTSIRQIIYTSIGDYLPFPKSMLFPLVGKKKGLAADVKPAPDVYKWKDVISRTAPNPPEVEVSLSDSAMFQYTGGTTGVSKGVILTHDNLSKNVQQIKAWFPGFEKGREIMLGALPFFHVFGMNTAMNLALCAGWNLILVPKPQPTELLEAIRKFKPTFAPLVPTMYIGILNHPDLAKTDMTCIKGCFSGSAPLPVEVIKEFEKVTGAVIVEGYGLTESSPVVTINPFSGTRKVGSIGIPMPDTQVRIVELALGEDDVPIGDRGELLVKGPQVMKGYWKKPDETASAIQGGWLFTGDIATMDEDGYLYIVDRKKDMIISGGYNVYPRDIDEVFHAHPKVKEVCTIGIPHTTRGEAVKVFIVLRDGEESTSEEMMEFCKEKLAKYKWPVEIEFRTELPKTQVGKILRKDLREQEDRKQR